MRFFNRSHRLGVALLIVFILGSVVPPARAASSVTLAWDADADRILPVIESILAVRAVPTPRRLTLAM